MRQRQRRNSLPCQQRRHTSNDRKSSNTSFSSGTGRRTGSRENQETTVMVVIIIVLIVCHTPDRVVQVLKLTSVDQSCVRCPHVIFYASNAANFLIVLNSSTNFLIYYAFRRRFRQNLWSMLLCRETRPRYRFSGYEMSDRKLPDELTDRASSIKHIQSNGHRSIVIDLSPLVGRWLTALGFSPFLLLDCCATSRIIKMKFDLWRFSWWFQSIHIPLRQFSRLKTRLKT